MVKSFGGNLREDTAHGDTRPGHLSDISDQEWGSVAPLLLMDPMVPPRSYDLREVVNDSRSSGSRFLVAFDAA